LRRFSWDVYSTHMDRLGELQFERPDSLGKLMMVGRPVADGPGQQDVYISVPDTEALARFDGFAVVRSDCAALLSRSPFSNDHERCPQGRIGIERVRGVVHVSEHGAAHRFGAAELRIGSQDVEG
jgi:hypothetical protein